MNTRRGLLLLEDDRFFQHLDVLQKIQDYGHILLHKKGKEYHGACPFSDCDKDDDGFMAWPELTGRQKHWFCRGCGRSGRLEHLVMEMQHIDFWEACRVLEIPENVPDVAIPAKRWVKEAEDWQKIEMVFLEMVYPLAWRDLNKERGSDYLAQRGISLETASRAGVGYLRQLERIAPDHLEKLQNAVKRKLCEKYPEVNQASLNFRANFLRRWFDSIVYPVSIDKRGGCGYASRTLLLWELDMNEREHKAVIETHNDQVKKHNREMEALHGREQLRKYQRPLIARHLATWQRGFFNGTVFAKCDDVIFVEGLFDALSLLDAGIENVVDIGGVSNFKEVAGRVLPASVDKATLAYDGDSAGRESVESLYNYCRYKLGFTPRKCFIPNDGCGQDWNERYREHGINALSCLLTLDGTEEKGS